MAKFLCKLLLKQRMLALHHNFQWLLVATKLISFSWKTQHHRKNVFLNEHFLLLSVYRVTRNYNCFVCHCSINIAQIVLWAIMDNHERSCILHTQANIRCIVVFTTSHQVCFRGVELTKMVVTRIFHTVTLKGWCLARHNWCTSKCGSYVLVKKIQSVW